MGSVYKHAKKNSPNVTITHDKFHVIKHITDAVDKMRKQEVKKNDQLKKTRYIFLKREDTMTDEQKKRFKSVDLQNSQTAKAWKMRENFLAMYECKTPKESQKYFNRWYKSVIHSNNKHIQKAAKTIKNHLENIITQVKTNISNARAEQANSKIAKLQRVAKGYKNFDNL